MTSRPTRPSEAALSEAALEQGPAPALDGLIAEARARFVPNERPWEKLEALLLAQIDANGADDCVRDCVEPTVAQLDADEAGPLLAALAADARARLVPNDRPWAAIEARVLERIDDELAADASGPELEALTRESRAHLVPPPSDGTRTLARVEARLHDAGGRVLHLPELRWRGALAVAAAAAAAWFVVTSRSSQVSFDAPSSVAPWSVAPSSVAMASAGVLGVHQGQVRVDGVVASTGSSVHAGSLVEVTGSRAIFDQPGRVTWAVEDTGRVRVSRTESGLVLTLERGATEAQVAPVPNGEAFAIDVADGTGHVARVAVHGTHLRVARTGRHVVIDLTEGIVTVGVAPRAGSTYGTLVTAPAHVELDVDDLEHVRVEHAPTFVRPAALLAFVAAEGSGPGTPTANGERIAGADGILANGRATPSAGGRTLPAGAGVEPSGTLIPGATVPGAAMGPGGTGAGSTGPGAGLGAEGAGADPSAVALAAAKDCFARGPKAKEVHVTVSSVMRFKVEADGSVRTFTFDPPISESTQDCVGVAVFALSAPAHAGELVRVPLELSR